MHSNAREPCCATPCSTIWKLCLHEWHMVSYGGIHYLNDWNEVASMGGISRASSSWWRHDQSNALTQSTPWSYLFESFWSSLFCTSGLVGLSLGEPGLALGRKAPEWNELHWTTVVHLRSSQCYIRGVPLWISLSKPFSYLFIIFVYICVHHVVSFKWSFTFPERSAEATTIFVGPTTAAGVSHPDLKKVSKGRAFSIMRRVIMILCMIMHCLES